ncbi:MAG: flagellar biosynthetic protein FliO [Acidobacteriota bacterium]
MADVTAPITAPTSLGAGGAAIQMAVALLLILFVILLAYYLLKRFGPRLGLGGAAKAHGMRVESYLTLGPRKNIMVVRFLNKLLVLGVTDQSINLLTEVDAHDGQENFQAVLENASRNPGPGGESGGSGAGGASGPGSGPGASGPGTGG